MHVLSQKLRPNREDAQHKAKQKQSKVVKKRVKAEASIHVDCFKGHLCSYQSFSVYCSPATTRLLSTTLFISFKSTPVHRKSRELVCPWSRVRLKFHLARLDSSRLDTFDFVEPVEQVETSVSSETSRALPTWRTTNDLAAKQRSWFHCRRTVAPKCTLRIVTYVEMYTSINQWITY